MSGEPVARFMFSGHCNKVRVLDRAFLPPPDLKLSVAMVDGLADSMVHDIARANSGARETEYKGFAEVDTTTYLAQNLEVERDDRPFFRHANVCGWPDDKPRQKTIAQKLASQAIPHFVL